MTQTQGTNLRPPAGPPRRSSVFARLAGWSQRHRWAALAVWLLVVVAATFGAQAAGSAWKNDFSLPGTESQDASDLLEKHGAVQAGDTVDIVFKSEQGVAANRDAVTKVADAVRVSPGVADVRTPFDDPSAVSGDGRIGFATVTLSGVSTDVPKEDIRTIIDIAQDAETETLQVEVGGGAVREAQEESGGAAEGAGMLAALVILVLLFGSVLAAALPLITALFAVGGAIGLITMASHVATVADFTPPIMMLVGLGVGVDYALLIFYRFRHELLRGAEPVDATRTALDAAGRTVFFAGCTVIIALLGLVTLGLGSLQGVALSVALTVLITMAASLTLLPALLAVFGKRLRRNVMKKVAKAERKGKEEGARWRRMAAGVQRRPFAALLVAVVALLALCAPALDMRLGFADAGNDAKSTTSRQAYDLMAEGFGPGFNGPLVVVAEGGADAGEELRRTLDEFPGVAAATPPMPSQDGALTTVLAFPESAPQDEATEDLVRALRDGGLDPFEAKTGAEAYVGGATAGEVDFSETVSARLPLFVAVVVGLSTLLLLLVFRSILIPLKAAVLNLLSIGASMGVMTLVFQHGWFGVQPGPIEAFLPVMIFAIVFGLSMDYEVFLLSRIHEEWERTKDSSLAVREGLATTGRVITAAAAIMIVVFGAFLLSPDRMLQQFGLGLAVAILLDALVIRCLIVPAVMQLFGDRAWWLPKALAKRLPRVALEGSPQEPATVVRD
ncbi:MMPL family transporter [Yinghuangia sp. YIM S09857]|uniref:MMPL family transporter n=1 Tax=Yinghuangia sp. YIM S09857 TaxID=3436929 RepID=UPI003F52917D